MTIATQSAAAWYVVETRPSMEKQVVDHLRHAEFDAYLPLETRVRRIGRCRNKDRVSSPLLPWYVFVEMHHDESGTPMGLDEMHELDGVVGLVSMNGAPRPIPTWWLNVIRRAEAAGAFNFGSRGIPNYAAGAQVRVTEGPFAEFLGEFICTTKDGRIKILMEALGGGPAKRVKLNRDWVEPLEPEPEVEIDWTPCDEDAA